MLLFYLPTTVGAADIDKQLFAAINQHDLRAVKQTLQSQVDPDVRNPDALISFQTPLSLTVSLGDVKIVPLLLKYGADIDLRVGFWRDISPLYIATAKGNLPMVKQLLAAGAKIDPNRWTIVKEILAAPWHFLQGKVIDLSRPPSLLEAAQESGNDELFSLLEERGAR
ncbi:MAG: ankyrin repeat domain-containing protein [Desulfuromonadales bacterium]|nr:ankyrin repeat domain-containing protein [Desulfuromonadales bacterium]